MKEAFSIENRRKEFSIGKMFSIYRKHLGNIVFHLYSFILKDKHYSLKNIF